MIFGGLGVDFLLSDDFLLTGSLCTLSNSWSKSSLLMSGFVSIILQTFFLSTFGSLLWLKFYTAYHQARPARANIALIYLPPFSVSSLLAFVAIKLLD